MIRRFGFKNFYSFKEGTEINFMLDNKVPDEIRNGRDFTTVLGVKGANGSGKTNIIKALRFLSDFCTHRNELDADALIPISSFNNSEEPCEFYIEFDFEGTSYYYELDVTKKEVIREELYRKVNRLTPIFKRKMNEITYSLKELQKIKFIKLNKNASVIGFTKKLSFFDEIESFNDVFVFFSTIIANASDVGYHDVKMNWRESSKEYHNTPSLLNFVKKIIRASDNGIKDIEIRKSKNEETGEENFFPAFIHEHNGKEFELQFHQESNGTKTLYQKLMFYWVVLEAGGVLAFDEFDIHIHAMILPLMIESFTSKELNQYDAQFIFTAHNTEIIDHLKKYRTVLVNKDNNESYSYRLDEIEGSMIRNDRSIAPLYLGKKIGGVPNLEDAEQ